MPTPITASTLSALLSAALTQKPTRPLVLALDGRCGSGKTTLANGLAAQLPGCTLLRTDDFYLPPARRSPDWAHTPCANMDLTRLRDEALRPAYAGQPVAYRAYSCREGAYLPPAQLPAQPLVILEGSYSHHPLLRPYETLRVFVTCTKAEQTRRLQAREGARYADFAARWVPLFRISMFMMSGTWTSWISQTTPILRCSTGAPSRWRTSSTPPSLKRITDFRSRQLTAFRTLER